MSKRRDIISLSIKGVRRAEIARRVGCARSYVTAVLSERGTEQTEDRLEAARLELLRARVENQELGNILADIRLKVKRHELIPRAEVRETFNRVFAPYRQAVKEVARRYGPDSAQLIADLVNGALEKKT